MQETKTGSENQEPRQGAQAGNQERELRQGATIGIQNGDPKQGPKAGNDKEPIFSRTSPSLTTRARVGLVLDPLLEPTCNDCAQRRRGTKTGS